MIFQTRFSHLNRVFLLYLCVEYTKYMKRIILFDTPTSHGQLKPLTLTRPVADIRIGIRTIQEKWQDFWLQAEIGFVTAPYLASVFAPLSLAGDDEVLYIHGGLCPHEDLRVSLESLAQGHGLTLDGELIAFVTNERYSFGQTPSLLSTSSLDTQATWLRSLPQTFLFNGVEIARDFAQITAGRTSAPLLDPHTVVYGADQVFIEPGASVRCAILNAEKGPIYIGKNAVVQEGSLIIGPVCIHEEAMVAWGSKIRPNTTLGPVCRVGGEVGNSIFHSYSNKAHDGFLGNSYLGAWCNLGANTTNSNLKNDYQEVKLYDYNTQQLENTGELFCGTFMGDFTKAGIMTLFNTGTVVGVSANVFGAGFQAKHIPSFSWGGQNEGYVPYRFSKAIDVIQATMARRNKQLTPEEITMLAYLNENPA